METKARAFRHDRQGWPVYDRNPLVVAVAENHPVRRTPWVTWVRPSRGGPDEDLATAIAERWEQGLENVAMALGGLGSVVGRKWSILCLV
jgi:hypothetical protein